MASLLEIWHIQNDSKKSELEPPATEDIQVTQARDLLRRTRSAGMRAAETILDNPTDPSGDATKLEQIAWARQTVQFPDGSATALLELSLADAPLAATVDAILTATDTQIQNTVNKMVPRLAKGLQVSSR